MLTVFTVFIVISFVHCVPHLSQSKLDGQPDEPNASLEKPVVVGGRAANMRREAESVQSFLNLMKNDKDFQAKVEVARAIYPQLKKNKHTRPAGNELVQERAAVDTGPGALFTLKDAAQQKCMDVQSGQNNVILFGCNLGANQDWYWVGNTIRSALNARCLTASSETSGAQVSVQICNGSESQTWFRQPEGLRIHSMPNKGGLCLEGHDHWLADDVVRLATCSATASNQRWEAHDGIFPVPPYDANEVRLGAFLAGAGYCNATELEPPQAGVSYPGCSLWTKDMSLVTYISDPASDVQAYIAKPKVHDISKPIVLSIRGTASLQDAWIDLQFIRVAPVLADGTRISHYSDAGVHSGFLQQYKAMRSEAFAALAPLIAQGYRKLMVVGHSLGGGVATLAALDIHYNLMAGTQTFRQAGGDVRVFTFGQPRVGDDEYVEEWNHLIGNSWRVVNNEDPVPCLPFEFLGFGHINHLLYYDLRAAAWRYNIDDFDVCGWIVNTVVGDHMMSSYDPRLLLLS